MADTFPKTVTLPSGVVATITREIKGRDMVAAQRIKENGNKIAVSFAMVAPVIHINGKPLVPEDLLDMGAADIDALIEAAAGKSCLQSRDETLPPSPNADLDGTRGARRTA